MKKRIFGLLLAVCLAVTALAAPAAAFTDVTDAATAVDVECLRLMGVLDGYADGSFRPDATLTRAQFCKMAVYALNAQKELGKYRSVTVFPDVKPSHWAASYINLASKGKGVILGFADGKFHPEATVTAGQAVTILMRQLGYKDEDVGAVWPDGYLAQAEVIGLTDGLHLSGGAPLTRGQAARLFVNLLRCDRADGGSYARSITDDVKESVMLVSSAASVAGDDTGMQTSAGTVYQMANKTSNGLLNGRMGTLLLDNQGKVITFVPDGEGASRTVVLVQAKANYLLDTAGEKFALDSTTAMYYNGEETTWGAAFSWLKPGMSVTLYLGTSGGVEYVFAGSGVAANQAVVLYSDGSTAGLDALTGGSINYRLTKNGAAADIGDLRAYDVVTYSGATNTLQVCDVRLSGIYESCAPTPDAPETITVMGHDFKVLPSAVEELAKIDVGSAVTLLLTADNQVAGVLEGGAKVRGNALGIVRSTGESGEVELLCGITVKGAITGKAGDLTGQLVRVSSGKRGTLSVSRLSGGVSGELKAADRTLGGVPLADNVVIYRAGNSGLEAVALTKLPSAVVSADQIRYAGTDWAGRVNIVVLGDKYSTVDYVYGRAVVKTKTDDDENTTTTIAVEYGNGQRLGPLTSKFDGIRDGQYVRASLSSSGSDFSSLLALKKLGSASNSAWTGRNAVTVGGRTYTVNDDVSCYNAATERWVTLDEAHAFADRCDLYVDGTGTVRVIEVDR